MAASLLLGAAGGALAQAPIVTVQPLPARVGVGHGVVFTVQAVAPPGTSILGYTWMRDGRRVAAGAKMAQRYVLAAAQPGDAGMISVDVIGSRGTASSQPVRLEVVGSGWVRVGGRPLATDALPVAPSVQPCPTPTLAWVRRGATGGEVFVHRHDGLRWVALGSGPLADNSGRDGTDPSLQCSDFHAVPEPVAVWSESAAAGRRIVVQRFDGSAWRSAGLPQGSAGADARRPRLQLLRADQVYEPAASIPSVELRVRSALAWEEADRTFVKQWSGNAWGGPWQPTTGGPAAHAMAVEPTPLPGIGQPLPVLLGGVDLTRFGAQAGRPYPLAQSSLHGPWQPVGPAASPPAPLGTQRQVAGLGLAQEGGRPRVMLPWFDGQDTYTLRSATLFSADYEDALVNLNSSASWTSYAPDKAGSGLITWSMDGNGYRSLCRSINGPSTWALALTDSRGTRVLTADCPGGVGPAWHDPFGPLPVTAQALSLHMVDDQTPWVATVERAGSGHSVSLWTRVR